MPVADRNTFVELYAGQPRWEIGRPQRAFLDVADRITGSVLDSGCGSGENALRRSAAVRHHPGASLLPQRRKPQV